MAAGETFIVLGAHKNAVQTNAMKIQFECDRNIHCQHEMRKHLSFSPHKQTQSKTSIYNLIKNTNTHYVSHRNRKEGLPDLLLFWPHIRSSLAPLVAPLLDSDSDSW